MRLSIVARATAALLASAPLAAGAASGCSSDTFAIKGTTLAVELCASQTAVRSGGKSPPSVTETLTVRGQTPLARHIALDAALGDETARTIDDAPLQALGIAGTLHMTISYRNGATRLEHALLVPGAIALK